MQKKINLIDHELNSNQASVSLADLENKIAELKKEGFTSITLCACADVDISSLSDLSDETSTSPYISELYIKGEK